MWLSDKKRITQCEQRLDELLEDFNKLVELFDTVVKTSVYMVTKQLEQKNEIEKDVEELKRQMGLTMRAQCATYSAALERVQAMLEHEQRERIVGS